MPMTRLLEVLIIFETLTFSYMKYMHVNTESINLGERVDSYMLLKVKICGDLTAGS